MDNRQKLNNVIYFDNAGTTFFDDDYFERERSVYDSLGQYNVNTSSSAVKVTHDVLTNAKDDVCEEILDVSNNDYDVRICNGATEANQAIINYHLEDGIVLVSNYEHKSIYGIKHDNLIKIGINPITLQIDLDELKEALKTHKGQVSLVSVMAANNEIPVLNDIDEIARLCRKHGVKLHTDASQIFGKYDFKNEDKLIFKTPDFLTFSLHKIYGRKGFGCLVFKKELIDREKLLTYTVDQTIDPVPFICTVMRLLDYNEIVTKAHYIKLRNHLFEGMKKRGVVFESIEPEPALYLNPFITLVSFKNKCGIKIKQELDRRKIIVSIGSACNTSDANTSHVIRSIGREKEKGIIRISFGKYNTTKEIDVFLSVINEVLDKSNY
jgi:cysteine desulfurase